MDIDKLLKELTLEEKASLCSGRDFWTTKPVNRVGIPSIMLTDGPHGLRKQTGDADHLGLNKSVPSTCFPTASATACSWDTDLMYRVGVALAEECLKEDVSVILGPGANIKRSPLCGRNFEYVSEDPYLSGEIAAAMINGIQSKGIGVSLKHFALNNQETRRMSIDAIVDERAKREIYLAGFERAVKKSKPWTVMCSYNRVDGEYLSDHKALLNDILREEWGYGGLVVSDWGACNDRVRGIRAGMDMEMPSSNGKNDAKIVEAVKSGKLSEAELDKVTTRILELVDKSAKRRKKNYKYDEAQHHMLAKEAAQKSCVLLKNEGILPLNKNESILVVGEFAKYPRYQGAGSSLINPRKMDTALEAFDEAGIDCRYVDGYSIKNSKPDREKIEQAVKMAQSAKKVVIFAGLTEDYESEGYDRTHLGLPDSHNELIKSVSEANPNTVIVLQNGAPVTMPWVQDVKGILECYLGGQAGSSAAVDILLGKVNPSGKLAETFPLSLEENPSYNYFPGGPKTVEYRESIYVGYRYYDKARKEVLFPFGYGLSYTKFEYSNLVVKKRDEFEYDVVVTIKNIGDVFGSEIIQLYVKNNESPVFKAEKELKGFAKVDLLPGEEKNAEFNLDKRAFAYYDVKTEGWQVDTGKYGILIGASSRDIRLSHSVDIKSDLDVVSPYNKAELSRYYNLVNEHLTVDDEQFGKLFGQEIPQNYIDKNAKIDGSATLDAIQHKIIGKILRRSLMKEIKKRVTDESGVVDERSLRLFEASVAEMPLRAIGMMAGDSVPYYFAEGVVEMINGRFFKGLGLLLKKEKR